MATVDLSSLNEMQRAIVTTLDRPVFVAAGAGSGKTFTLTRRIVWALSEGSGPYLSGLDEVLVITFTDAAATEIAARLRVALREAGLYKAAQEVDNAWISTIHGMCLRILKRHALDLGLDPRIRLAHENEAKMVLTEAMEEVLVEAFSRKEIKRELVLAQDDLGLGSLEYETGIYGVVLKLIAAARKTVDSFDGFDMVGKSAFVEQFIDLHTLSLSLLDQVLALKKEPKALEDFKRYCEELDALAQDAGRPSNYQNPTDFALTCREFLLRAKLPRSLSKDLNPQLAELKQAFKACKLECTLTISQAYLPALIELARKVENRRLELEKDLGILENDDVVGMALDAVKNNEQVAKDYAGHFRLAMVDEFQDTDAKQLELISLLSGGKEGRLATVGDAQQSIYRFRGADVGVFTMREGEVDPKNVIKLSTNYRSHKDILALVDRVCGGAEGVVKDFMHLDANPSRPDGYIARELPRIQMIQIATSYKKKRYFKPLNAALIADKLYKYHMAGEPLSNMCLLLGATTGAARYIDALRARGLNCVLTGGSVFGTTDEVQIICALLWTLTSPKDTEKGLFPLLASEMFELDATDFAMLSTKKTERGLAKKRLSLEDVFDDLTRGLVCSKRLDAAIEILTSAEKKMGCQEVGDICEEVLLRSGWLLRLEKNGSAGAAKAANILAAIRYIKEICTDLGLGPSRAAHEFSAWLERAKISPKSLAGGIVDAIQIMTVHASKGLEFPIVALTDLWADPKSDGAVYQLRNPQNPRHSYIALKGASATELKATDIHPDDPKTLGEWQLFLKNSADEEEAAEKTRLLYVGLTRAREALIVSAPLVVAKTGITPALALKSYAAFYMGDDSLGLDTTVHNFPEPGSYEIDFGGVSPASYDYIVCEDDGSLLCDNPKALEEMLEASGLSLTEAKQDSIKEDTSFDFYTYEEDRTRTETKLWSYREGLYSYSSASAELAKDFVKEHATSEPELTSNEPSRPRVMSSTDDFTSEVEDINDADKATNFGSSFHELAQLIVESGQKWPKEEQIEASKSYWKLSKRQCARLDIALKHWFTSKLRQKVLTYSTVRAEVPFFTSAQTSFGDFVEGAIDLLAYNNKEEAFLVDYKTGDRGLSLQEIYAHHEMQANFYAWVLMKSGFKRVCCNFVTVELQDEYGELFAVHYNFDSNRPPKIGELTL